MDNLLLLSVKDAALLLTNRELLKDKTCAVNVQGKVQVVSEFFRSKTDQLFIIQLGDNENEYVVNILVKQPELQHWQRLIWPNSEYVFTCLRATTLLKGVCQSLTLFVPVKGTEFHQKSEGDEKWESIDVKDLFKSVAASSALRDPVKYDFSKVHNYSGVVTDINLAQYGILELDKKIRLFVVFMPSWDKIKGFGVGTKICVFNVHQKGSSEFPKIHLCCCALSSLKVQELSPLDHKKQPGTDVPLANWAQTYNLSLALYDQLWKLESCLWEAFGAKSHSLMKTILQQSSVGNEEALLEGESRNVLQEILIPNHQCPVTVQCTHAIPEVMTPIPVYSCLKEEGESLKDLREIYSRDKQATHTPLSEQLYWTHGVTEHGLVQNQKILVGVIQLSSRTGQIVLKELTSATELILVTISPDMLKHKCQSECFTVQQDDERQRKSSAGHSSPDPHQSQTSTDHHQPSDYTCPFIHTPFLNCIVRIDRFLLVMERFIVSNFPSAEHIGESKYVSQLRRHSYVVFSMKDLTVLLHPSVSRTCASLKNSVNVRDDETSNQPDLASLEGCSFSSHRPEPTGHNNKRKQIQLPLDVKASAQDGVCECKTKVICVIQTESLVLDQHASVAGTGLRFTSVAVMLDGGTITTCSCHTSCSNVSFAKKKLKTQDNTDEMESGHSSRDLEFYSSDFNIRSKRIVATESVPVKVASTDTTDATELREVNLLFLDKAVKWYNLLQPRYLYRICYTSDNDMKCVCPSMKLKSFLQKTNAKQCYVLDSDSIRLESLAFECLHEKAQQLITAYLEVSSPVPQFDDFRTIFVGSCSSPLISIVGRIVRRQHYTSDTRKNSRESQKTNATFGVSMLDSRCIHVTLHDLVTSRPLSVYMNLHDISYPLSLLPGALVEMKHVLPRVSQKGQVYCQYLGVSTTQVLAMPRLHSQDGSSNGNDNSEQPAYMTEIPPSVTHQYLSSMWSSDLAIASHIFYSLCQVVRVLRLSLKMQCQACGSVLKDSSCMSSACNSTAGYLYARASILVDDGSSTAIVQCCGETVRELLALNVGQWIQVEQLTRVKGEVYLHQPSAQQSVQVDTALESFLHQLCDSNSTKRQIKIYLTASAKYGVGRNVMPAMHDFTLQDFIMKTVETMRGYSITTHSLPFLHFTCVRLEAINCSLQVTENLQL